LTFYCYAECPYAECPYAECPYAECPYAACRYAECCHAFTKVRVHLSYSQILNQTNDIFNKDKRSSLYVCCIEDHYQILGDWLNINIVVTLNIKGGWLGLARNIRRVWSGNTI
jgi:hypothetical protein